MLSNNTNNESFAVIASSTEPKMAARIGTFDKHGGRRVVTSAPSGQYSKNQEEDKSKSKFTVNASLEELDKLLEDDALALLNIKKDINEAQVQELAKLRISLIASKKEYDSLLISNNIKEKEFNRFAVRYNSLVGVDKAINITQGEAKSYMQQLQEQTSEVLEELASEQRTLKMQNLMIKRLDEEIGKCRIDTSKAVVNVEHLKHDLALAESNLQVNRQYLIEQEGQLEKLNITFNTRKDQRNNKINMLHSISVEGENSVAKLQHSLMENSQRAQTSHRSKRSSTGGRAATAKNQSDIDDVENLDSSNVSAVAKRLNLTQLKETLQRYQTQSSRIERLQQLDQELRNNILSQQKKKQELSEHLTQTQIKIQQLASSRQIYQEVASKDAILASTSKECEEAKDKDFRLRLNIEELKQSIPRFLTKITKVQQPKPTEDLLADAVSKLEDELIKFIKSITSALVKDATPDDLAVLSQQSSAPNAGEASSEFGRLQRLPGFNRMQRQLFFNMMTAKPDTSDQNIRVENPAAPKKPADGGPSKMRRGLFGQTSSKTIEEDLDNTHELSMTRGEEEEPSLGRNTIKNISKLIIDRDSVNKPKSAAVKPRR